MSERATETRTVISYCRLDIRSPTLSSTQHTPFRFHEGSTSKNDLRQTDPISACSSHNLVSRPEILLDCLAMVVRPLSWYRSYCQGVTSQTKRVCHTPQPTNTSFATQSRKSPQTCHAEDRRNSHLLIWNELKLPEGSSSLSNATTFIE